MRRRQLITLIGAACASGWVHSQEKARPAIGLLSPHHMRWQLDTSSFDVDIVRGMGAEGWQYEHFAKYTAEASGELDDLAAAMVARPVSLIYAVGPAAALAAMRKTSTIPIVYIVGGDPVSMRLAKSLRQPEGNATGVSLMAAELTYKRLEVLLELMPPASRIGVLLNAGEEDRDEIRATQAAGRAKNVTLDLYQLAATGGFDATFSAVARSGAQALWVTSDPYFLHWAHRVTDKAKALGIPAIYPYRQFVTNGGLLSYGPLLKDAYFEAGRLGAQILMKGARPADLAVVQPRRFDLAINRTAAKAIGLAVPTELLVRANLVVD
jgi:putative tryptophan/tyrosine transport system substrate-binding protein